MTPRSLGHRAPLLWIAMPWMAGLAWGRWGPGVEPVVALGVAVAGAVTAAVAAGWSGRWWAVALTLAGVGAGSAAYGLHRPRLEAWDGLPPREVHVELEIERTFAGPEPGRAAGLARITAAGAHLAELRGQRTYFVVTWPAGMAEPLRGAKVRVTGVLAAVPEEPEAGFERFLADAGVNFRLSRARATATVREPSAYRQWCARAAERFAATLGAGVEAKRPELTGVLRAMMLGRKHELSDEHGTLFLRSGTMHLFAISGLHIAVIAAGLQAVLALARLPAGVRFVAGTVALWLYTDITGATPSSVRAFLMATLLQASWLLRAPGNPVAALALAATIVATVWPLQVFSASFQLSYGIVAALLLLGLPLGDAANARWALWTTLPKPAWRWWHAAGDWAWRGTLGAGAIGVATTLVSTPMGVALFGLLTPGGLVANLVLIPLSSLAILAGFVSLLCGLAGLGAAAEGCNHAAVLVLWGIEAGVRGTVALPGTWWAAEFVSPWVGPAASAATLAAIVAGYRARWSGWAAGGWPPLAVVGTTLLCGVRYG